MDAYAKNRTKNILAILISMLEIFFALISTAIETKIFFYTLATINVISLKIQWIRILTGIQYFILGILICLLIIITGRGSPEGWWEQMWNSVDLYVRAIPALGLLLLCWWASDFMMRD